MSGPRLAADILAAWARGASPSGGLTLDECESTTALLLSIADAIRRAQKVPASIDRRCMALVVTKLEEAEHWAIQSLRVAVERADELRDQAP